MNQRVFLLKPCRGSDEQSLLSDARIVENYKRGIETSVILDLNILNRISQHVNPDPTRSAESLAGDIIEIKKQLSKPLLFITAGFALGEADESYLDNLIAAYESFFVSDLPGYVDAPNALPAGERRKRSKRFVELPASEQLSLSFAYLALLKIHDILLSKGPVSGPAKFDDFLEFMDGVADLVPAIEVEVAKHCFFASSLIEDKAFIARSRAIRDNFNKGGRGEKRVDRILNGARDIMYLRGAAFMDGHTLDGVVQDTWLLTCDAGVAALSDEIYFVPRGGERSKYATTTNSLVREKDSYWRYVDNASDSLVARRTSSAHRASSQFSEAHVEKLRGLALALAESISARASKV